MSKSFKEEKCYTDYCNEICNLKKKEKKNFPKLGIIMVTKNVKILPK